MPATITVVNNQTIIQAGENTTAAAASATVAAASAAVALAASGPNYTDAAAGLAATAIGDTFAVDNGDGTITVYSHDAGPVATDLRTFPKNILALLASTAVGKGDDLVVHDDGETVRHNLHRRVSEVHADDIDPTDNSVFIPTIWTSRNKIILPGADIPLTTGLSLSQSNLWFKGVPGKTRFTSATLKTLLTFGDVSDIVFEDIMWETTLADAVSSLSGVLYCAHKNLTNLRFVGGGVFAPDAYINGVKFIVDNASEGIEGLHFENFVIEGAGRMGIEIQNHNADLVERYHNITWRGGYIKDTGLQDANGQAVSLSGPGSDCEFSTLVDNPLFAAFENVGCNNLRLRSCRTRNMTRSGTHPLSWTDVHVMDGCLIEDFRCEDQATGSVILRNQTNLRTRHNIFDVAGNVQYTGCRYSKSEQDKYICDASVGLALATSVTEGANCDFNEWSNLDIDHSGRTSSGAATVRFSGTNCVGNRIKGFRYSPATGGVLSDNTSSAKNNFFLGPVEDYTGAGRPSNTITFPSNASYDASADIYWPQYSAAPYLKIAGTLTGPKDLYVPDILSGRVTLVNNTGQTVTVRRVTSGAGVGISAGARATILVEGSQIIQVGA